MLAVSFMVIILVGSGVLLMPRCIQPGVHLSWIDSLFTTTSAVCVTGLTTIDVPSTFTSFGQLVIMVLIQIGGLGMMTITSFFALFFMVVNPAQHLRLYGDSGVCRGRIDLPEYPRCHRTGLLARAVFQRVSCRLGVL